MLTARFTLSSQGTAPVNGNVIESSVSVFALQLASPQPRVASHLWSRQSSGSSRCSGWFVSCLCITTGTFSRNVSWWDLVSAHRDAYHLSMVCTWVAPAVFCTFRSSGAWCCTSTIMSTTFSLSKNSRNCTCGISPIFRIVLHRNTEEQHIARLTCPFILSVIGSEPPCTDFDQRFW